MPGPAALAGYVMYLVHVMADDNTAYDRVVDEGEPSQLYRVDLAKGTRQRLAGRDDVAIAGILHAGHDGAPFGVTYDEDKPSVEYLDPASDWAQLHVGLLKAFPGQMVSLRDWTRDERKMLFMAWGDRHPGASYLFDSDPGTVQLVTGLIPWIDAGAMA